LAAALVTVVWLHSVPAANAQAQPQAPGTAGQAENIPDQKLDQAAAAIERMARVKQEYQQRISKEASPDAQQKLADEGNNAMEKAVTDQGLSVQEYSTILEVAQNNPVVREKIIQRITPKPAAPSPQR
jgi:DNA-binding transcriptional regulator YbjK